MRARPRLGVSACLLGQEVRWDAGHKRDSFLVSSLAEQVSWVPVCPEVEVGMPVPREPLRLVGTPGSPRPASGASPDDRRPPALRMIGQRTGTNHTADMEAWAAARAEELAALDLDGYVFKKDSPSCGVARVRVYPDGEGKRPPVRTGTGLFAAALAGRLPDLPITEEGWLRDTRLRESFLDRAFSHARVRTGLAQAAPGGVAAALVELHAAHKFLYMAHSPARQKALGQLVARAGALPPAELGPTYLAAAMDALAVTSSRGKHANVLQHILGYFRELMSARERDDILERIEEYRRGTGDLAVPLALLAHHLRRHDQSPWLASQVYFDPWPRTIAPR